jgi:competence protein ComEA
MAAARLSKAGVLVRSECLTIRMLGLIRIGGVWYDTAKRFCDRNGLFMSLSRSFVFVQIFAATSLFAQLPDGPGKEVTAKLCSQCHEIERAFSIRQDHDGWQETMNKMVDLGLHGSDEEKRAVVDYLAKNFPAQAIRKVNVNTASAIELEAAFSLKRPEAAAVVDYRTKNGKFKSLDDLKKVPGVDFTKIEARKDRLAF